jgi:hypothetical protein
MKLLTCIIKTFLLLPCSLSLIKNVVFWRILTWNIKKGRSQWPRGLRRRSAAQRLLGWWARIPPGAWMFVSCTVFVLSGRGLCDRPIPRPEESYRLWCISWLWSSEKQKPRHLLWVGRRGNDYERTYRGMWWHSARMLFFSSIYSPNTYQR